MASLIFKKSELRIVMKKEKVYVLFGISFLTLCLFSFRNPNSCDQIRNGKFYYFEKKSREKIIVQRFDSLQLEKSLKKDDTPLKSKIVWKGDCQYDMFINALSESPLTGDDSIIAATPARIKIIHIDTSFYVCTANLSVFGRTFEVRDTMYFLRQ